MGDERDDAPTDAQLPLATAIVAPHLPMRALVVSTDGVAAPAHRPAHPTDKVPPLPPPRLDSAASAPLDPRTRGPVLIALVVSILCLVITASVVLWARAEVREARAAAAARVAPAR